jgi:hypothetical protein
MSVKSKVKNLPATEIPPRVRESYHKLLIDAANSNNLSASQRVVEMPDGTRKSITIGIEALPEGARLLTTDEVKDLPTTEGQSHSSGEFKLPDGKSDKDIESKTSPIPKGGNLSISKGGIRLPNSEKLTVSDRLESLPDGTYKEPDSIVKILPGSDKPTASSDFIGLPNSAKLSAKGSIILLPTNVP